LQSFENTRFFATIGGKQIKKERKMTSENVVVFLKQNDIGIVVVIVSAVLCFVSFLINSKSTPSEGGPWESKKQMIINEMSFWPMIIFGSLAYITFLVIATKNLLILMTK
jgi:hypothetical protein